MITHEYYLDMTPGSDPLKIHVNQQDANFRLLLTLFSDIGTLVIEDGTTARIRGKTPGGNDYDEAVVLSNGIVTVDGNESMCDDSGIGIYEICLTKNNKELYSSNFYIIVERITRE